MKSSKISKKKSSFNFDSESQEILETKEEKMKKLMELYKDIPNEEIILKLVDERQGDLLEKILTEKKGEINIDQVDSSKKTPLMHAIQKKELSIVKTLIKYGADWRPIHYAAYQDETGDLEQILEELVDCGANINTSQMTALHLAVLNDSVKLSELLMRKGCKRHKRSVKGKTPVEMTKNSYLKKSIINWEKIMRKEEEERKKFLKTQMKKKQFRKKKFTPKKKKKLKTIPSKISQK